MRWRSVLNIGCLIAGHIRTRCFASLMGILSPWRREGTPSPPESGETAVHPVGANLSSGLHRLPLHDETIRAVVSEVLHDLTDRCALCRSAIPKRLHLSHQRRRITHKQFMYL